MVADASGLGRAAAAELQKRLEELVGAMDGVSEVRVALMADKISRKIVAVGSGKGGVGKSMTTVNLGLAFARRGARVGLLDVDLNGPCVPRMLGLHGRSLTITPEGAVPAGNPAPGRRRG